MSETIENILYRLVQWIPYLVIICASLSVAILLILEKVTALLNLLPFLLAVLGASIFLIIHKKKIENININNIDSNFDDNNRLLGNRWRKVYAILFLLTFIWILLTQSLNIISLGCIVLLYIVSVLQIFSKTKLNAKAILVQLILTSSILVGTQIFSHALYYSIDDILPHVSWAKMILESGFTIIPNANSEYFAYPLEHIGIAIVTLLSGSNVYLSPYLFMVIPAIFTTFFVYLIANYLTHSTRISLGAAFLYLMIPCILTYATSSMPFVLALIGLDILLLLLVSAKENRSTAFTTISILIVLTCFLMFVHHASAVVILPVLILVLLAYLISHTPLNKIQIIILITTTAGIFVFFIYHYLSNIISFGLRYVIYQLFFGISYRNNIQDAFEFGTGDPAICIIFTLLGILLALLIIGLYFLKNKKQIHEHGRIILPLTILVLPIFFGYVIIGGGMGMERYLFAIAPILAITLSFGIFSIYACLSQKYNRKKSKLVTSIIIIISIIIVILSPVCITAASDAEAFQGTDLEYVNYVNEDSLSLISMIETYVPDDSTLRADSFVSRYYIVQNSIGEYYNLPHYNFVRDTYAILTGEYDKLSTANYLIFRHALYQQGQLEMPYNKDSSASIIKPNVRTDTNVNFYTYNINKCYENRYDRIYLE